MQLELFRPSLRDQTSGFSFQRASANRVQEWFDNYCASIMTYLRAGGRKTSVTACCLFDHHCSDHQLKGKLLCQQLEGFAVYYYADVVKQVSTGCVIGQ